MTGWMGVPADGQVRRSGREVVDGKSIRVGQGTEKSSVGMSQLEDKEV